MKKMWMALCSVMLVASITACGNNKEEAEAPAADTTATAPAETTPAETTPAETTTETPAEEAAEPAETTGEASSMSAEELLNKAQEASKELKSYNMVADIEQNMSMGGQEQASKTKLSTDIFLDPISAHQIITTDAGATGEIEQYITQDDIYTKMGDQWTKLPEENKAQVMSSLEGTADLDTSFEQFKSVAKDMKVTEEGNNYVLTADLSGEDLKKMAGEMLSQQSGGTDVAAMLEQMNIEKMHMVYAIDKETSYPTETNVDMTMTMDGAALAEAGAEAPEGEDMNISVNMVMKSTISKHNEIKEITVPKEVTDSAQ
ncbi:hypothetical protein QWJ34_19115 [Saccharibacillus sp. CPCC 101409]|uniref:DUF6612 family protein n=1 Tax=Saccharibacillus sp. CPCC 101409 TaxID=3058041 RepID=UPI0026730AAB|nr:DUF6612 family protein [Saccharibacillus sp. CPCC 101409]MDO3411881.1 hypothetical protein [Saccharibacillus sp. CPCC 101409]